MVTFRFVIEMVSLLFTAGSAVLLFFIILGGTVNSFPLNIFYFIEADTSQLFSAPALARWTFWGICSVSDTGRNIDCTNNKAAFPFDPVTNFHTITNMPEDFIVNSSTYYYLTRFAFSFAIIALFFTVITLFVGLFSICSRLAAGISSFSNGISLLFLTAMTSLLTANYVMAVNTFHGSDRSAKLGVKMMAFMWAAVALQLIAEFGFGLGCCLNKGRAPKSSDDIANDQDGGISRSMDDIDGPVDPDDSSYIRTTSIRTPGPNGEGFFKSVRIDRKSPVDEIYTEY